MDGRQTLPNLLTSLIPESCECKQISFPTSKQYGWLTRSAEVNEIISPPYYVRIVESKARVSATTRPGGTSRDCARITATRRLGSRSRLERSRVAADAFACC